MKAFTKSIYFRFLFVVCLAFYLTVSFGAEFSHTHEPDIEFHDNCPACQWQVLHMDDFSQIQEILNALGAPLDLIGYEYYSQLLVFPSEILSFSYPSRAPPLSI